MGNLEVLFQLMALFFVVAAGPAVVVLVASQKGNL
uniref:Photosystem II reaction center protein Psb30 n=2 Tax=Uronema TaxID=104535 RepID=A0A6H1U6T6_9CHLO|nr:hypothetical chloroplast RF12 [Uronema confervicola]QIZ74146.1 hypothetical chloroplast RF12 [Uronema confervicola]QIZ74318.1 hypothetical chloroplast RF12 [Uronema sp. FACHB-2429]